MPEYFIQLIKHTDGDSSTSSMWQITEEAFESIRADLPDPLSEVLFYPCDPKTYEQRWEAADG